MWCCMHVLLQNQNKISQSWLFSVLWWGRRVSSAFQLLQVKPPDSHQTLANLPVLTISPKPATSKSIWNLLMFSCNQHGCYDATKQNLTGQWSQSSYIKGWIRCSCTSVQVKVQHLPLTVFIFVSAKRHKYESWSLLTSKQRQKRSAECLYGKDWAK